MGLPGIFLAEKQERTVCPLLFYLFCGDFGFFALTQQVVVLRQHGEDEYLNVGGKIVGCVQVGLEYLAVQAEFLQPFPSVLTAVHHFLILILQ